MSFDDDVDDRRRRIALFREEIMDALDIVEGLPRGEITARIQRLALKTWQPPSGQERSYTERTLWSWWSAYKSGGLLGLLPESRKTGPREVTPDVLAAAIKARSEVPTRSTKTLIDVLEKQQFVAPGKLKRSTLDRHLEAAGASRRRLKTLGDKVYTRLLFEHPNDFWVGDYHEGPILWVPASHSYRTIHLSAFVDHYSKVVPHAQWYDNERLGTLEDTFKKATLKRGLSGKVYVDRGGAFRSDDFGFACAHLGVRRVHSRPYAKEARGLIERFNRTIAEGFEPEVRAARIDSIERINHFFEAWLEERYHLVPHGRWVRVFYDPFCLDDVLVFLGDKRVQRAFPQKVNAPQLMPERPVAAPPSFDYLGALRAEYDRRIVEQAKHLSLSEWKPSDAFTLKPFLDLCAQMLGKDLSAYEREDLTRSFNGVGPFSEKTVRLPSSTPSDSAAAGSMSPSTPTT